MYCLKIRQSFNDGDMIQSTITRVKTLDYETDYESQCQSAKISFSNPCHRFDKHGLRFVVVIPEMYEGHTVEGIDIMYFDFDNPIGKSFTNLKDYNSFLSSLVSEDIF